MILKKLTLENFQGIVNATFEFPNGCSSSIYGDNGTGKTTVFNAVTWILFGNPSTGAKNYTPKTRGSNGELHNLNHSADAEFVSETGRVYRLQKVFHEVYKKKRGAKIEEFDGNTIDYYVDGVPVKEKEYSTAIQNICGDSEKLKILTMPDYFPETMPWDARRKILLDVCGNITDADVISSNPELEALYCFLQKPGTKNDYYTIEEYRKIAMAQRKEINRNLENIPARIDEAQKAIPDVTGLSEQEIRKSIIDLQHELDGLKREKDESTSDSSAEIRKMIANRELEIAQEKTEYVKISGEANAEIRKEVTEIRWKISSLKRSRDDTDYDIRKHTENLNRLQKLRESLIAEYKKAAAIRWDSSNENCPCCGQPLPEEKIMQMQSDFNLKRSNTLTEINQRGQNEASKDMIQELQYKIDGLKRKLDVIDKEIMELSEHESFLESGITDPIPFEQTDDYKALFEELNRLKQSLENEERIDSTLTGDIDSKIADVNRMLQESQEKLFDIRSAETQSRRISELEAAEKEYAVQFEQTEHGLYLCDQFTKSKIAMLDESINSKFGCVKFQLFTEQVNGGLKDGCEVMIPTPDGKLVPYAFANHAARANAGLEIIDTLSNHWGIRMPVFIDNAESITRIKGITGQMIRLVVSENDKVLRQENIM